MSISSETLHKNLKNIFGFNSFKGKQEEIIQNLLKGNDSMVIMPTGGGKSMCYQLPALLSDGVAIIISPLIALMKNQVDQLRAHGIQAHFLNSTLSKSEATRVKKSVLAEETKLLYVAPESLTIEITGDENKLRAVIDMLRPYGIRELVRTGKVAIMRSTGK